MVYEIFSKVLEKIVPTEQEIALVQEVVDKLRVLLEKRARELKIQYTVIEPQGSTGIKQTQLKNDFDIDVFIGLDYELYKPKYEGMSDLDGTRRIIGKIIAAYEFQKNMEKIEG